MPSESLLDAGGALINVNGGNVQTLEILLLTTLMMILPSLIVMMTSFTRYVVVFSCATPWARSRPRPIWCWWGWRLS